MSRPFGAAVRSPDDYRRGGSLVSQTPMAGRPGPSNVTDGRFWGDEAWADLFLPVTAATADQAAKVSAVHFCVSTIAEIGGSLPVEFQSAEGVVEDFELADVVAYAPNPMQTGAEFWSSMIYRAMLGGFAFAEPVVDGAGVMLWPLNHDRLQVDWRERGFTAWYTPEGGGTQRMLTAGQLFWFAGLADGGIRPLTPWKMAKGSIDFALALETMGRDFFRNGAKISGTLSTEQKLTAEVIERLKEGIARWKHGQTPVLEQGLTYNQVASTNSDAQLVELIRQRTLELARYWRIPRALVGEESGPQASHEQQMLDFVKFVIRPLARRIEQAINVRLLTPDQRRRVWAKMNIDGLLRGDSATQHRNAVLARTASGMSINEVRTRIFNLPRIEEDWADDVREPLNSNRAADTATGGQTAPQDQVR
jgi:HK97 family phage portal protein